MITVSALINASVEHVWKCWTSPEHIVNWNFASPDWCCPDAVVDLKDGGDFSLRMEARDGSMGFDFGGTYSKVVPPTLLEYTIGDGRKVSVRFADKGGKTEVTESFEPEQVNSEDLQRAGWQAILNNFKAYTESESK